MLKITDAKLAIRVAATASYGPTAVRPGSVLAGRLLGSQVMAAHERGLGKREDQRQAEDAEDLEVDPEIGALGAPDHFVETRHGQEEKAEAQGELAEAPVD